jgi:hypothetical protein
MIDELWGWWVNMKMMGEYKDDVWIMRMMGEYEDDVWIMIIISKL